MNNNAKRLVADATVGAATLSCAFAPAVALAEDNAVGAGILIPEPAEFIPALISFVLILVIMSKLAWPSILGVLDKRQHKIEGDLDAAENARAKAAQEEKELEERVRKAHIEAEEIVAQAKKEVEEERSRTMTKAQKDAAEIVAKSHRALDVERKKAMIELSSSVVDLSVEIASKIIGDSLSVEQQRKLAEKYLAEMSVADDS